MPRKPRLDAPPTRRHESEREKLREGATLSEILDDMTYDQRHKYAPGLVQEETEDNPLRYIPCLYCGRRVEDGIHDESTVS